MHSILKNLRHLHHILTNCKFEFLSLNFDTRCFEQEQRTHKKMDSMHSDPLFYTHINQDPKEKKNVIQTQETKVVF